MVPPVLVLTATVNPGPLTINNLRPDPNLRLEDYRKALRFWLAEPTFTQIVFCENSAFDLSSLVEVSRLHNPHQKAVEFLSFLAAPFPLQKGKSYGELMILEYVLQDSALLRNASHLMKVTGRYRVPNIAELLRGDVSRYDVICDFRRNLITTDSRVFCASLSFLREYLLPLRDILDESACLGFERTLARAVHRAMADGRKWTLFPHAVDVRGIAGTRGRAFPHGPLTGAARELLYAVKRYSFSR